MHFLCLHGIGTNNKIFKMQTAAIRHELGDQHTYEFVQGTVEWPLAPELKGLSDADEKTYSYFEPNGDSVIKAIHELSVYIKTEGPFDGVIGFSQGASLAVMYLIFHAHLNPDERPPFACAILFSRIITYDPIAWHCDAEIQMLDHIPIGRKRIDIPVTALWAENDLNHVRETGPLTGRLFEDRRCESLVHTCGHEVPGHSSKSCMDRAVKAIRRTILWAELSTPM